MSAAKNAEDGDGIILRFVETAGKDTEADIDVKFLNFKAKIDFKAFEIKTLKLKNNSCAEVNLIEF